jgi:molybdopterin-containing oxidoreductase family iron-sulfur binding subunit
MEKCTFCIQRIKAAEYKAKLENRKVRDGDIMTACQQTCPTDVFTFGDLMDESAAVTKRIRNDPRGYQALKDLNTKPAVIYLKRIDASNG